jgi:hypothetical protein
MASFLFWNLNKRPLAERVVRLAVRHGVDVLLLAECLIPPDELVTALNTRSPRPYTYPASESRKLRVFARQGVRVKERYNDPGYSVTIRSVGLGRSPSFLLAVTHLPSKLNWDREDQTEAAKELVKEIAEAERDAGHQRTALVGDLNMDPYEPGVVLSSALHGVMTRRRARQGSRTVMRRNYRFFYNPMWGCFGDRSPGPPGTHHRSSNKFREYFWHIYDQVLLRPALMDRLTELEVLPTDGTESLLTPNELPDKRRGSDHLPLLFRLDL